MLSVERGKRAWVEQAVRRPTVLQVPLSALHDDCLPQLERAMPGAQPQHRRRYHYCCGL